MLWVWNCGFLHLVPDTLGVWTDGVMVRHVCTFVYFGELGALFSHCMSRVGILDLIASPSTPLSVSQPVSQSVIVREALKKKTVKKGDIVPPGGGGSPPVH